jgi:hypothetical protein
MEQIMENIDAGIRAGKKNAKMIERSQLIREAKELVSQAEDLFWKAGKKRESDACGSICENIGVCGNLAMDCGQHDEEGCKLTVGCAHQI